MKIMNLPSYATEKNFIVVTNIDDELWFYGAYDDMNKAAEAASTCEDRIVISPAIVNLSN